MRESDPLLGPGLNGRDSSLRSNQSYWSRFKQRLNETVDVNKCGTPLAIQCFIAGAADAAAYSQTNTWAAFMVSLCSSTMW